VALSLSNLRRSLGPIHALNAGIRRIAKKDFSYRVHISSKDEFEELAHGFNDMSSRLGDQFQLLSIQGKIDQATLMTRDFSYIARLSITRVLQGFAFDRVAISRVNVDDPDDALIFVGYGSAPDVIASYRRPVDGKHLERFHRDLPWMTMDSAASLSNYLPRACLRDIGPATLFPIFVKDQLYALLSIVGPTDTPPSGETLSLIRQIGDHLAVAWSNVNMVRELRGLTVGSMQALARAVDAKSPWTAGHSARVMRFALGIGRHLALPQERIDQLQQAALLHDIGKIGISSAILDKPGKLTDAEFAAIREHPAIGDRILAPIPVFKELIPMVRGHHERWDGNGYPDGVSGEAIVLEARILSVADVYDAMVSDRPYRRGMGGEKAIAIIKSEAGRQFDPRVVEAFVELMEKKSALAA
jgi:HAMP domain-containing protein